MRPVIVVGANRIGLAIAERINNSVLVEADPAKYTQLKREHPDMLITGGDARLPEVLMRAGIDDASALVLVIGKDHVNHKIALTAREYDIPKVVAVLHDESYRQSLSDAGVTDIISPEGETINAILEEVYPAKEIVTDIVVTRSSPAFGKRMQDISVPENCVIGAILKGDRLLRPRPEMILEEGDVLTLVSLGEMDVEVYETLAGDFNPYIPREKMIFLLLSPDDMEALEEGGRLAKSLGVPCEVVMESVEELKAMAIPHLDKTGCEYHFSPFIGDVMEHFVKYVAGFGTNSGVLACLHQGKKGRFGYQIPLKYVKALLRHTHVPLLIARGHRYERIVHMLDSTRLGERCTRCAVGIAIETSSSLYALYPHSSGSVEHDIVRTHAKRMARIYDIEVVEEIVEGDPTIEFVQKVRAKASQLVVLNWDPPTVRRDIMMRIINDAEASILIVERQAKL